MSSAVNPVCKVCGQTTVDGRPYFEQRQTVAPFGWDRVHQDCNDPTGAKGYRARIAELEAALRPFADTYRFIQPMGAMRKEYEASMTCGKFTVQDLARAAELVPL